MAIAVQCSGCRSRIGAPDNLAGKKVKCPKCAKMLTVPGGDDFEVVEDEFEVVDDDFEVVDDDKPARKPKRRDDDEEDDRPAKKRVAATRSGARDDAPRRKRAVQRDEEDDDDDDDDDRPRRKKAFKKKSSTGNTPLLIGGGVLVALLLCVGGYFAFFSGKGKDGSGGGSGHSSSWTRFDAPDGSFSALFPTGVPENKGFDALAQGENPQEVERARGLMTSMGMKVDAWVRNESGRDYSVMILELPAMLAAQMKPEELLKPIPKGGRGGGMPGMPGLDGGEILNDTSTNISGQIAKQILAKEKSGKYMFARMFFAGNKLVIVGIRSPGEITVDDRDALEYFNKFEWKAAATGGGDKPAGGAPKRRGR